MGVVLLARDVSEYFFAIYPGGYQVVKRIAHRVGGFEYTSDGHGHGAPPGG